MSSKTMLGSNHDSAVVSGTIFTAWQYVLVSPTLRHPSTLRLLKIVSIIHTDHWSTLASKFPFCYAILEMIEQKWA